MDRGTNAKHGVLERMLLDASVEPTKLPLSLLEDITNDFSDDHRIGSGGFAVVYKGILENATIAVKKLCNTHDIHEEQFHKEVGCLMKVKHKNVVRCLGYCSDTQGEMVDCNGKSVMAEVRQRLLCFEYLPRGSLDKYITGASCVLEWTKRYRIIKEICEGLHYLHMEWHIVHLDLKPTNILLDNNMIPKIADFGLSRHFGENQSHIITAKVMGTLGYMAPEIVNNGKITIKSDIYSLGVIITEMLTGERGYYDVEAVLNIWRDRLHKSQRDIHLEQVRVCAQIGIECTEYNPAKRPVIQCIIDRLDKTEGTDWSIETGGSSSSVAQAEKDSSELHQWTPKVPVPGETSYESITEATMKIVLEYEKGRCIGEDKVGTTLLVLSGKSSQDQQLLASTATSLSIEDGELSVVLAPDASGGFDVGAYMGALSARRFGTKMLWSPQISSTQDLVYQNLAKLPVGVVCVADTQFKGRGVNKNVWISPPGCLMFSFKLRMGDLRQSVFIQYLVCVAMVEAIKELTCDKGLPKLDVKIKWPNNLYLKGLKVGGILCNSLYQSKVYDICIGIGLNVDNDKPTTCLNAVLHELKANSPRLKREDILASFFNKFEVLFEVFLYQGFQAFGERYYDAWLHSGQKVVVQDAQEGQYVDKVVTIRGLTSEGYLYAVGEGGKSYEIHPDGNSFDFLTGLVARTRKVLE